MNWSRRYWAPEPLPNTQELLKPARRMNVSNCSVAFPPRS